MVLPLPLTMDCGLKQDAEPLWASAFSSVKRNQFHEDYGVTEVVSVQQQNHSVFQRNWGGALGAYGNH